MKKPKRLITNGELSQIIVNVCVILCAVLFIGIIIDSELALKFKIVDSIFLLFAVVFCSSNLRGWIQTLRERSKMSDAEESEEDL